jgi:hypothetical protein
MNLVGYRNISIVDALHRTIRQAHDQVHSEGDRYGNQIEGGAARTQGGNGGWRQRRRIQWLSVGRGVEQHYATTGVPPRHRTMD